MKPATRTRRTFVSLFCGCGGFDLGFIQAGFSCAAAFDIDPVAVEVHRKNLQSQAEVTDLTDPVACAGVRERVDVVLSGSPCQGFSTAGKRDVDDARNHLLPLAGRIAVRLRPRVFVAENVVGVTAGSHSKYWHLLRRHLQRDGYRVAELVCDASKMGVAQIRRRMVMVAWLGQGDLPEFSVASDARVLRDVLQDLDGVPNHDVATLPSGSPLSLIARHLQPGQKLCNVRGGSRSVHTWDIPEVFGVTSKREKAVLEAIMRERRRLRRRSIGDADPVDVRSISSAVLFPAHDVMKSLFLKGYVRKVDGRYDLTNTFNGKSRRCEWSKPSYTVDTKFTDPKFFLHPSGKRGFTVREAARIQGFPDSFVFLGTQRDQIRHVANAVPPPVALALAKIAERLIDR